jgi:DNA-binding transcriptional regulator YiaG
MQVAGEAAIGEPCAQCGVMPNLYLELRSEIARLARKEVRLEVASLKKTVALQRSSIARLKESVSRGERELKRLNKSSAIRGAASVGRAVDDETTQHRFRPEGLASLRKRLGLSARELGLLVGVSTVSVYKWEAGSTRPRPKQIAALAAIRGIGKREAATRLATFDQISASARGRAKRTPAKKA